MNYIEEVLDRATGELVTISKGDWITISELAARHGVGPREARTVLRRLNVLVVEGAASHQRHRLAQWVVRQGGGKRLKGKAGLPFDVVSPDMQEWIAQRWSSAVEEITEEATASSLKAREALRSFEKLRLNGHLTVQQAVSWLVDHYPSLTQGEMAMVLSVTQQLVSRHLNVRVRQRRDALVLRRMDLDERKAARSHLYRDVPYREASSFASGW